MAKGAEAFRSIGEVAGMIGVAPHVLRYWETQFSALKPMKRPDGRRYYRPADVDLAAGICVLLRDEGLTIRGAVRQIAVDRGQAVRARGVALLARRHQAPGGDQTRPAQTPTWLARLTALADHLQHMSPADARWPAAQPAAFRLARAMLRLS
ncbi:MAG: MerR family transcriptional regulator [Paracoccus hibiscisoli]|uniref:MerR family transcriptional regulator n=1 Tax=Paracoccus hibiscisoli TaxID=2023261 RepID=UPI00391890DA